MPPSKRRGLRNPYICLCTYFNSIKSNTACTQVPVPPAWRLSLNQSKSYIQPKTAFFFFFFPESLEKGPSSCPEQGCLGNTENGASWQWLEQSLHEQQLSFRISRTFKGPGRGVSSKRQRHALLKSSRLQLPKLASLARQEQRAEKPAPMALTSHRTEANAKQCLH